MPLPPPLLEANVPKTSSSRWRSLRYLFSPRPWPIEMPVVVHFPVNDICDSKCQMCNIWQQHRDREITVEQARQLYSSPLFREVVAVGLNGGEPTLRRDLADLGAMLFDTLPSLKQVSLITNGLHARRAIDRIADLGEAVRSRGGKLDVMVSLDGVGDVHDRVRGVPGNFDQAVEVLDFLRANPDLASLRVGCTVITENAYHLHDLLDFCRARGTYVKYRLGVPNRRLYNLPSPPAKRIGKRTWIDTHPFGMDPAQRWHFAQFLLGLNRDYETSLPQVQFYRSLAAQLAEGAPRRAGCDWQHRGVTVSSRGEVLYCAVQSDLLGDGLATDPAQLYFGGVAHLRSIVEDKCAGCAHDYVGPPGGRDQAELMADRWLRKSGSSLAQLRRSPGFQVLRRGKNALAGPIRTARLRRELRRGEAAMARPAQRAGTLLCGWYGTETLGDKAIVAAIVGAIRRESANEAITIASLQPALTRLTVAEMPELQGCEVVDVDTALATVAAHRALVFAGGPLMAIEPIHAMESLFRRARSAGVATIIAGCGVGPLGAAGANAAIRGLLECADQRIFRDAASRDAAIRLIGPRAAGDAVAEDPATGWVAAHTPVPSPPTMPPVLGLGLRDWPHHEYARGLSQRRADAIRAGFEDALARALEDLVAQVPGLRILPVPFCTHDAGGDDRLLYWRLLRRSAALRAAFDTRLMSREAAPADALAAMTGCRAFLAMRFHSLVFASTLGLPVVSIDYTLGAGKTHALAQRLGCPSLRIDMVEAPALLAALRTALAAAPAPIAALSGFDGHFARAWAAAGLASLPTRQPA
jgi:MoaA/NifB/PqqE/SkfB family radical SAM enzyme/polysaccharide pyruvyl transferase WcaK-like protein